MTPSTAIVWFRRDLRVHDHPSLSAACAEHERVVPVFVLDRKLIGGRYASGPRTAFMLRCLRELRSALIGRGSGLIVRDGEASVQLVRLAKETGATAVYWASDVGPYALARDRRVTKALKAEGIDACPQPGNFCADVSKPRTGSGKPYAVFTPFWRAWADLPRRDVLDAPSTIPALPSSLAHGDLPSLADLGLDDDVPEPVTEAGETAARAALDAFLADDVRLYSARHDDLTGGTSVLSPHLRWGTISARETEARVASSAGEGRAAFRRQLAWRDFYAHVLLAHPANTTQAQQPRYRSLKWENDDEAFEAWKQGMTGFPLVDAAMRQLARTGWMHNRARMVVASFLTKDLHIDWREGERWFAAKLLDGEPSQNNGNWQWVASTGADPAPYFRRMFNPTTQAEKFDPDGEYVRRWVPEFGTDDYPDPIVDHQEERRRAIERYRATGED